MLLTAMRAPQCGVMIARGDLAVEVGYERLAELQEQISLGRNQTYVGKVQDVLVEGHNGKISIGRAYHDAPEIDGMVFIDGQAPVGEIVPVRISGAMTHDLSGALAG